MKRVLIITYYWPPSGGAGVQRWLKFARYLPEFGWDPVILTVDRDYAAYPAVDESLFGDIPTNLKVFYTPAINFFSVYRGKRFKIPSAGFAVNPDNSLKGRLMRFVRGNFFIPDPRKGWNSFAFRKACEIIEKYAIEDFITTSPPHSTQLIGLELKRRFPQKTWIADLRDPWTDIYYYHQFYPTRLSKAIDSNYEKKVLKYADKVITVGDSLKKLFSEKLPGIENKIHVITNGFDESDFMDIPGHVPALFTITYVGTLSDIYPVGGFLEALRIFRNERNQFLLRFVGTVSPDQKELITRELKKEEIEFIPPVPHRQAIEYMASSSMLLLIIPDHPSSKSILTGKLFEYMATGKRILCLGPEDGDAAGIIKSVEAGACFGYSETDQILNFLKARHSGEFRAKKQYLGYSRKELTNRLAVILQKT